MNHNCIIVYESIYNGNTEKLAKTMAQTLGCHFIKSQEALKADLSQYKTIGFGSGIYFGCHHTAIFEVVKKLDRSEQDVFIFSSRGAPVLGKYHQPIKELLNEKRKKIVGEFSVRGYDETGPWVIIGGGNVGKPDEKDLKKAVKEAATALHLKTKTTIENLTYEQVNELLHLKWISPLCSELAAMPSAVITQLTTQVQNLADKYAVTYSQVANDIKTTEQELAEMLGELTGNEFDRQGLAELKKLLMLSDE